MDLSTQLLVITACVFLLAGSVKGLIGVGFPTICVALLINLIPISEALALVVIPGIITNVWQASVGGQATAIFKRFWLLFICLWIGCWFGVEVLAGTDQHLLSAFFGFVLMVYALVSLFRPAPPPPGRAEPWLSPIIGVINGVLTGLTGSYVIPGVLYLQALGLNRDALIQAMGVLFLTSTLALGVSLAGHGVMNTTHAVTSTGLLIPSLLGYAAGQHFRHHLDEQSFRKVFFIGLLLLGAYTFGTNAIF